MVGDGRDVGRGVVGRITLTAKAKSARSFLAFRAFAVESRLLCSPPFCSLEMGEREQEREKRMGGKEDEEKSWHFRGHTQLSPRWE